MVPIATASALAPAHGNHQMRPGGRSDQEGEDADALDGHQWTDHQRDAQAVSAFEAGEPRAGNETHEGVVHDLHDPDHPEHPHRADHLSDGGDFGDTGVHIFTSATTAKWSLAQTLSAAEVPAREHRRTCPAPGRRGVDTIT